ncbi:TPR repeat-containing thioredoxin TTL1-like [Solanum verrucosum]|uniref:TPR repeat-containing thioredoxin TTL1-like n=1 Tax=Solanum verrucosum TaxID=315347 RepID=UPI0020D05912|nr:TPR repeat-containing thioredoxin TTL1-like [Solanum verrucosum]
MSGSNKKSVYEVGSSSLADEMKNSLKFEEDDERRRNSGKSASVSGQNVSYPVELTPGELNIKGHDYFVKGDYKEALSFFDKAIASWPGNGPLHCNRAAALIGLMRYTEARKEFEEAIRLAPTYVQPRKPLGLLLLCLGQVENAREHLFSLGQKPDQATLQKLQAVAEHINKCTDARKLEDWTTMLKEAKAATTSGADSSPQLCACQAEASLKLHQLKDAEMWIYKARMYEPSATASQSKFFGMLSEAYIYFVQAQIDSALGKFDDARTAIERAARIDLQSAEVTDKLKNMRLVGKARILGNEHFHSKRYAQACTAYGEGLLLDSSNSVLYYNRANCCFKLGEWEKSLADSNRALLFRPQYTKALYLKAASNIKLERWADAVRDYEILRQELPNNEEVAENLSHARVELKKSHREGDGKVELVSDVEKFQAVIASGESVVYFNELSNPECIWMSSVMDTLSVKYRSVIFLKVDVEQSPAIAAAENITAVPKFNLYKDGSRVMDKGTATSGELELLIKDTLIDPI